MVLAAHVVEPDDLEPTRLEAAKAAAQAFVVQVGLLAPLALRRIFILICFRYGSSVVESSYHRGAARFYKEVGVWDDRFSTEP